MPVLVVFGSVVFPGIILDMELCCLLGPLPPLLSPARGAYQCPGDQQHSLHKPLCPGDAVESPRLWSFRLH